MVLGTDAQVRQDSTLVLSEPTQADGPWASEGKHLGQCSERGVLEGGHMPEIDLDMTVGIANGLQDTDRREDVESPL